MTIYHFEIHSETPIELAWQELEIAGIEVLYSDEDPDGQHKIIVCRLAENTVVDELLGKFSTVQSIQAAPDLSIDWEAQWADHSSDFHNGHVHIRIGEMEFILKPGPGFGDASHPSTRLVLQMMEKAVPKQAVLDVGCGSGILAIAAAQLDANAIYAIDIDPAAIRHTIENIALNEINKSLWVGSAEELIRKNPERPIIALMNMISSEQQEAWKSLEPLHESFSSCITSGILADEKEAYLETWKARGWKMNDFLQEDEWLAFHFIPM